MYASGRPRSRAGYIIIIKLRITRVYVYFVCVEILTKATVNTKHYVRATGFDNNYCILHHGRRYIRMYKKYMLWSLSTWYCGIVAEHLKYRIEYLYIIIECLNRDLNTYCCGYLLVKQQHSNASISNFLNFRIIYTWTGIVNRCTVYLQSTLYFHSNIYIYGSVEII